MYKYGKVPSVFCYSFSFLKDCTDDISKDCTKVQNEFGSKTCTKLTHSGID